MLDIKRRGGGGGYSTKAAKEEEGGRESTITIYPVVRPYPPHPPIAPQDNDNGNDNGNDDEDNFRSVVIFLGAAINQYMMN